MDKVLCIYHKNCADGLIAAWAVRHALGADDVDLVAAKYVDYPPGCIRVNHSDGFLMTDDYHLDCDGLRGRDVLIVDFSYPLAVLRGMAAKARSVLVLDHHATAQKDLAELPSPPSPYNYRGWLQAVGEEDPIFQNLSALFDMNRSGAGIAWDYLHGQHGQHGIQPPPRPLIVDLAEDYDLWKFDLADSRAFHTMLTSYGVLDDPSSPCGDYPNSWDMLDWWHERSMSVQTGEESYWDMLIAEGRAILRAGDSAVRSAVAG